jgi:ABC-type branched-subunit amino acid transport system substrate-binding protein
MVIGGLGVSLLISPLLISPVSASSSSKSTVTVAMISQITGPGFGSPEAVTAAKAVVKQINAQGGLGGHPIKLVTCNDKGDPTDGGNCARTAVSDHAVAVVEGISLQDTTMLPILAKAKIPLIESPTEPIDWTNPYSFPTDAGTISLWGGEGAMLAQRGCQKVGILYDSTNQIGGFGPELLTAGVEGAGTGATVVGSQGVSETAPELGPAITTLEEEGATCIGTTLVPAQFVDAVNAVPQSADPTIQLATIGPAFPQVLAAGLGNAAKGILVDSVSYLPGDARGAAFTNLMAPFGVSTETSFAENAYGGFKILQAALKGKTGTLTSSKVRADLQAATNLKLATYPETLSYARGNTLKAYKRLTNLWVVGYAFNGSIFAPLTGKGALVDAQPALAHVAASS